MLLKIKNNRNFWIMLLGDTLLVFLAYFSAHMIRFEGVIDAWIDSFRTTVVFVVPFKIACFYYFEFYKGMWRYTSIHDLANIIKACAISSSVIVLSILAAVRFAGISRSIFLIDMVITFFFISGFRVAIRLFYAQPHARKRHFLFHKADPAIKRLLIIGAGSAGEKLFREIRENPDLKYDVVGFVDDHPGKLHKTLHRAPVLGPLQEIDAIVSEYDVEEIIIAIPSASAQKMRRIVGFAKATGVPFKTLPGIGELVQGKVTASAIREVRYEDLLDRQPVSLKMDQIGRYLAGKRVLVTGGAGSIGSELCRQIAAFKPEKLVIVERNESGLYDIDLKLKADHPGLDIIPVLGAIQNKAIMRQVFEQYQPQTVFHAAAYKHVPMMELHPWEAVFNNVVGTQAIIDLCDTQKVERCVVVSTDKAVRPTNVMGATKRMIERITQCYATHSQCRFMAVRFGNVLGSAGSVLPLFKRQIEAGGPVTVTDPEVTRYFMTIPEACSLILQAGAIGVGNEIFVLRMGTSVRIDSMARDLITLSGFAPDEDIKIEYTGLRPGEKLYEELITDGEDVVKTEHEDIMVLRASDCLPATLMDRHLEELVAHAKNRNAEAIKTKLCEVVPEYCPSLPAACQPNATVISMSEIQEKRSGIKVGKVRS